MAQENPNRLVEWLLLLRRQWPVAKRRFQEWLDAVREEPVLIWETPAVRFASYGLGGLILALVAVKLTGMIVPPPPVTARPAATTADYHVVCVNPDCGHHFVIHRKFGFRGFPVACPNCEKATGLQARRCYSQTCQGRWIAPIEDQGSLHCPICGNSAE